MSFLDAARAASINTTNSSSSNAPELSLEEALAFFDGYDDPHSQSHQQHVLQQQFLQQQQQQLQHLQQHQQHQQQAMNTDVLMMMDDGPAAADDFAMGAGFLYGSGLPMSAGDAGADFGLMLQPLHLDDAAAALLGPPTPVQASPMQTLLAAPFAQSQSQPAPASGGTTAATKTQNKSGAGRAQTQRAKVGALPPGSALTPPPATATSSTGKTAAAAAVAAAARSTATGAALVVGGAIAKPATNSSSTKRVRRQKEELLYLRTKVVELEERLQQLRRVNGETSSTRGSPAPSSSDEAASSPVRRASSTAVGEGGASPASISPPSTQLRSSKKRRGGSASETEEEGTPTTSPAAISPALLASVWENVAERQYKERLRAEQQNKKLKTMLESQIKLATSLEKILKKRPNMEVLHPDAEPLALQLQPPPRAIAYAEETDAEVFARQARAVVEAFPRAADVLAATGFFTSEETQHDFRVKDFPDEHGVLMEFMAQSSVPFDLEITGNALWRFMSDVSIKKHCYFEEVAKQTETEVSRSFGVRASESGKDFDMRGKHTMRKFVDGDRVVVVSTSLVDPIKLGDAKVRGLRLDDVAWIVAQRSASNPRGASVIRACVHIRPLFPEDAEDAQDDQIGALTDFVLNSHESNSALCVQLINDLLVEEEWKTALLPVAL